MSILPQIPKTIRSPLIIKTKSLNKIYRSSSSKPFYKKSLSARAAKYPSSNGSAAQKKIQPRTNPLKNTTHPVYAVTASTKKQNRLSYTKIKNGGYKYTIWPQSLPLGQGPSNSTWISNIKKHLWIFIPKSFCSLHLNLKNSPQSE